jgi:predicted transcriptional regulator
MTLTIHLPPDSERLLQERASETGQSAETIAEELLAEVLEWYAQDSAEAARGIQRGLDDFAAGRSRPFEEFAAEQREKYGLNRGS